MNPENQNRQPSSYHKITWAHALKNPTGLLAEAVTASIPQVLLAIEDVTGGRGRVEVVALNYKTAPNEDRTSVGRIEDDGSAVSFFHSVTNGKLWWHIHYKLKILTGIGSYEELQRSLTEACPPQREKMGSLGAAFAALGSGAKTARPLISALALEAPKKAPSPARSRRTPPKKASAPAKLKKNPAPKRASGTETPDGSPEKGKKKPARRVASGPMPIDLGEAETLVLFASYCRDAGLPEGKWVTETVCAEAIRLAVADTAGVSEVPDEWLRACQNRLAGADLLREVASGEKIFFQLVLEGEEEAPFCPPNQTEDGNGSGTSDGGVAPEESLPEAFPPEPGPQEDSPPEPEPEAFAPPEVDETPAPDSRAETIRALKEADGEVQRLSRELSVALLRQSNLVASL